MSFCLSIALSLSLVILSIASSELEFESTPYPNNQIRSPFPEIPWVIFTNSILPFIPWPDRHPFMQIFNNLQAHLLLETFQFSSESYLKLNWSISNPITSWKGLEFHENTAKIFPTVKSVILNNSGLSLIGTIHPEHLLPSIEEVVITNQPGVHGNVNLKNFPESSQLRIFNIRNNSLSGKRKQKRKKYYTFDLCAFAVAATPSHHPSIEAFRT